MFESFEAAKAAEWRGGRTQPWMGKVREETEPKNVTFAGLYNFDAVAYESVLVGLFDIYRCKGGPRYGCPLEYEGHDLTGHSEFDSLYAPPFFLDEHAALQNDGPSFE